MWAAVVRVAPQGTVTAGVALKAAAVVAAATAEYSSGDGLVAVAAAVGGLTAVPSAVPLAQLLPPAADTAVDNSGVMLGA